MEILQFFVSFYFYFAIKWKLLTFFVHLFATIVMQLDLLAEI